METAHVKSGLNWHNIAKQLSSSKKKERICEKKRKKKKSLYKLHYLFFFWEVFARLSYFISPIVFLEKGHKQDYCLVGKRDFKSDLWEAGNKMDVNTSREFSDSTLQGMGYPDNTG